MNWQQWINLKMPTHSTSRVISFSGLAGLLFPVSASIAVPVSTSPSGIIRACQVLGYGLASVRAKLPIQVGLINKHLAATFAGILFLSLPLHYLYAIYRAIYLLQSSNKYYFADWTFPLPLAPSIKKVAILRAIYVFINSWQKFFSTKEARDWLKLSFGFAPTRDRAVYSLFDYFWNIYHCFAAKSTILLGKLFCAISRTGMRTKLLIDTSWGKRFAAKLANERFHYCTPCCASLNFESGACDSGKHTCQQVISSLKPIGIIPQYD